MMEKVIKDDRIKKLIRNYIDCNVFDGEDRSHADGDSVAFSAPDLYELMDEIAEHVNKSLIQDMKTQQHQGYFQWKANS